MLAIINEGNSSLVSSFFILLGMWLVLTLVLTLLYELIFANLTLFSVVFRFGILGFVTLFIISYSLFEFNYGISFIYESIELPSSSSFSSTIESSSFILFLFFLLLRFFNSLSIISSSSSISYTLNSAFWPIYSKFFFIFSKPKGAGISSSFSNSIDLKTI